MRFTPAPAVPIKGLRARHAVLAGSHRIETRSMMSTRPLRALVPLFCALALAAPATASAVVVGIGDDNPSFFADPHFVALGIHESRLVVPWNTAVTPDASWRRRTREWLNAAAAAHVTPLVSFTGDGFGVPSLGTYTRAVGAFVNEFPTVRRFTAWNEPDWIYRSLGRNPALAAHFFDALSSVCNGCTVVAGDVYLPAAQLAPWLARYAAALHRRPAAWALHDYYDVRDHSTAQLRVLMRYTHGQIWLDETGGVERRGHWQPASPARAAADERYLFSMAQRFPRISRIYHYQWRASRSGWDSALVSLNGALRPAYQIIAKLLGRG
jgi:hypothetical protein